MPSLQFDINLVIFVVVFSSYEIGIFSTAQGITYSFTYSYNNTWQQHQQKKQQLNKFCLSKYIVNCYI